MITEENDEFYLKKEVVKFMFVITNKIIENCIKERNEQKILLEEKFMEIDLSYERGVCFGIELVKTRIEEFTKRLIDDIK